MAAMNNLKTQRRNLAYGVGLFLFTCYLLTYRGGFHSVDEVSMFAVTESLVKFGQPNTNQIAWTQWTVIQAEAQGFFGVEGQVYSKKGLGLSLIQAPMYWLALHLPHLGMLQTVSLVNGLITALTGSLLFMFLQRLGYALKTSLTVSLIFGLATIAAVYAKYLFSEPLAALCLLLTAYMLFTYRQEAGLRHLAIAGLAAGLSVLTRANNLFLLPMFGLYLMGCIWQHRQTEPRTTGFWPAYLLPLSTFILFTALSGIILMGYNDLRSGDPFQTGYDLTLFTPNIGLGLYKLLFSPLRGLFVYSPILLLSLPGWWLLRRRHAAEAWLFAGCIGITLALFSAWSSGEGLSWGSRFLVPLIPMLTLMLAPMIELKERTTRGTIYGLLALSATIQLLAVSLNPWVYLSRVQTEFGGAFFLERTEALYNFGYSPIVGQLQSWSAQNSDLVWWQSWGIDWLALGLSLTLTLLSGWLLSRLAFRERLSMFDFVSLALAGPIILSGSYFLLARYQQSDQQFGPQNDGYTQALQTIVEHAPQPAAVITVDDSHYHVTMNRFKASLPLIGFARQKPPLPETAYPLIDRATSNDTIWLVTHGFAPAAADNAIEKWLTFNSYKVRENWLGEVRLLQYATAKPPVTQAVNAVFENEIRLTKIIRPLTAEAGSLLPVQFHWRAIARPTANYNLFLQLLDRQGNLTSQHDSPPNSGYTNTASWFPAQQLVSRHALELSHELPPQTYRLIAGLYDPLTGLRLMVNQQADFVDLGQIDIVD